VIAAFAVCVPAVAVTVTVLVPVGVPGFEFVVVVDDPLPPQPASVPTASRTSKTGIIAPQRRRLAQPIARIRPGKKQAKANRRDVAVSRAAVTGAVVLISSVAEFAVAFIVLQSASDGSPEHATVIAPPEKLAKLSVVDPLSPGAAIVIWVGFAVTAGGAGEITMEKFADAVAGVLSASVTMTVKLKVPLAVGVPEIAPVGALSCNPGGKLLPDASDHAYGLAPPAAASELE
jgi:hypothetical protein